MRARSVPNHYTHTEEEAVEALCQQTLCQLPRVDKVVLYAVAWPQHRHVLESADGPEELVLCILRHGHRNPRRVHHVCVEPCATQNDGRAGMVCAQNASSSFSYAQK